MSIERDLLPPWAHIAPQTILVVLLAIRPPVVLRLVLTAAASYYYYTLIAHHTTGQGPIHDYSIGSVIGGYWAALFIFLWLCDPMKEWRWRGVKHAPADYPFLKRIYYAACIVCNARLIGWSAQVANVPPPTASSSRAQFLRHRFPRMLLMFVLLDFAESYWHLQPLFPLLGTDAFPTGWRGCVMRFQCLFAVFLTTYANLNLSHILLSMFCVATGLFNGNPADWRPLFGSWTDAYTLRRLWGKTWHQYMQRYFTIAGRALASALGFKKGTIGSRYTQLFTAFALSGLIHVAGDVMVGPSEVGKSMWFFLANAAAIAVEDTVIKAGCRLLGLRPEPTRWWKGLGYLWVIMWCYMLAPLYVNWMVHLPGVIDEAFLQFSIVRTYAPSFVLRMMQATL
ncbi:membrane bound O-acyl transferase family-domain-containing protein [Trametes punicea]|nr:membrane bound O-acyl transferase family-domain-containing protein [Trametes punicea]